MRDFKAMQSENKQAQGLRVIQQVDVEPIESATFCGPEDDEMSHQDWLEWAWVQA
jgi:hypothetical protein